MKKRFLFISLIFVIFTLSSCYDYLQSISYSNGKYRFYYKISVPKTLLGQDKSEYDESEFFDMLDKEGNKMPDNVVINKLDNAANVGVECFFEVDPLNPTDQARAFFPTKSGDKCYIPFLLGNQKDLVPSNNDNDEFGIATAIYSCARNQVLVSKKIIQKISTAYFEGVDGDVLPIDVYDYGDCYCLDISIALLLNGQDYCMDRIVVRM